MLKSLTLTYIQRFEYHFLNNMFHKPAKQASEGVHGKGERRASKAQEDHFNFPSLLRPATDTGYMLHSC